MAPIPALDVRQSTHALISSLARRLPLSPSSASALLSSRSNTSPTPSSPSIELPARILRFLRRQQSQNPAIIPTTYSSIDSGPAPGTIVGIVLGSVGGFLLVLWLIYTCMNFSPIASGSDYTESVVVRERRKSHGSRSTRSRRMSETVEVRRERTRSPIRIVRPERVERVIVEESRETRRDRSRGGSDEVVVIEEHSPPRRSKSKKDKESGYRTVDPLAYGGVVGGRKGSGSRR